MNGVELSTELLNEGVQMFYSCILPDNAVPQTSSGGGGGSNEDNNRKKDEDDMTWAKRCAQALAYKSSRPAPHRFGRR